MNITTLLINLDQFVRDVEMEHFIRNARRFDDMGPFMDQICKFLTAIVLIALGLVVIYYILKLLFIIGYTVVSLICSFLKLFGPNVRIKPIWETNIVTTKFSKNTCYTCGAQKIASLACGGIFIKQAASIWKCNKCDYTVYGTGAPGTTMTTPYMVNIAPMVRWQHNIPETIKTNVDVHQPCQRVWWHCPNENDERHIRARKEFESRQSFQ